MGGGAWTKDSFLSYSTSVGRTLNTAGVVTTAYDSAQNMFKSRFISDALNPLNVIRECVDSDEHPYTIPVILALDVTGSMGKAAMEVAKKLNTIMTSLYEKVNDVEFLVMGIGDLAYDDAPIQASQFESDVRIAEQLDKIYFEGGGGGNGYESYTAAWYFGLYHTMLDCWKRHKKGIIITMGDEPLNPYLPCKSLINVTGDNLEADVDTAELYKAVTDKFEVFHLMVDDKETSLRHHEADARKTFGKYLDGQHLMKVTLDSLASTIVDIVLSASDAEVSITEKAEVNSNGEIAW